MNFTHININPLVSRFTVSTLALDQPLSDRVSIARDVMQSVFASDEDTAETNDADFVHGVEVGVGVGVINSEVGVG